MATKLELVHPVALRQGSFQSMVALTQISTLILRWP